MSDYEPGTLATATVRGEPNVRVFRLRKAWAFNDPSSYIALHDNGNEVTDVRPLVALDIPVAELRCVAENLRARANYMRGIEASNTAAFLEEVAEQIEQQTRPPKPAEPAGLGAVVEDKRGKRWTRVKDGFVWRWRDDHFGEQTTWKFIDAVAVLSEGVTNG